MVVFVSKVRSNLRDCILRRCISGVEGALQDCVCFRAAWVGNCSGIPASARQTSRGGNVGVTAGLLCIEIQKHFFLHLWRQNWNSTALVLLWRALLTTIHVFHKSTLRCLAYYSHYRKGGVVIPTQKITMWCLNDQVSQNCFSKVIDDMRLTFNTCFAL